MKIYLENGEVMDFDTCPVCKKEKVEVEELTTTEQINLSLDKIEELDLQKLSVRLAKKLNSPVVIKKVITRRCDCGHFPEASLEFKQVNDIKVEK